jgi:hypothetical protein
MIMHADLNGWIPAKLVQKAFVKGLVFVCVFAFRSLTDASSARLVHLASRLRREISFFLKKTSGCIA